MRIFAIVAGCVMLGACASSADRQAAVIAKDDATCQSYGAEKGSSVYVQCRAQLDRNRTEVRASERFGNAGGLVGAIERATQE